MQRFILRCHVKQGFMGINLLSSMLLLVMKTAASLNKSELQASLAI